MGNEEQYYYYDGKKVKLTASTTNRAVQFANTPSPETKKEFSRALGTVSPQSTGLDLGNGIILFQVSHEKGLKAAATPVVEGAIPLRVFDAQNDATMILTQELIAQFKPKVTRAEIDKFNKKNKVTIVRENEWEKNSFLLSAEGDALDMANKYQESGLVVYSQPNFVRLMKPAYIPNDSLFSKQWALRNTGQTGGIVGQDIGAVAAWDITRGSSSITIAIIDEGVDYTHEDLNVPGKLVTGYDAVNRVNDPSPSGNDAHGTACAGIAAAAGNNARGISGVAPGCRIRGIRIAYEAGGNWVTDDAKIADGINTAVARGADVLSNSWGGGSPSQPITNAIRNAKAAGRGGKGCVVCFASLNGNAAVSYPGTLSEVITVGACNEYAERKSKTSRDGENWWGSNYGPEVDVVAPGVHITTTDIMGTRGYNSGGNYVDTFNGTSAATPHVSGVAALILSINPSLTATEVENILRNSTDDLAASGYDIYTGFGRINAFKAVRAAQMIWGSPMMVPGWFGAEDQEGDIAIGDISRNGRPDLLVFHIDNPGGENHGYYRIGWDLNAQGIPASWSAVKMVPGWFGSEDQGAGVALYDVNKNGKLDLVVFHIDNPGGENHGYYRIGWDLDVNGNPTSWSPVKAIPNWFGAENQGGGIAVADLNGDGQPELIVFHIDNPGGENHGYYRIGWKLNSNGDVTGGWTQSKLIPGWFGAENQGGGVAVADINGDGKPEFIVFHIDNPTGDNHGYYRIGRGLDAAGNVAAWTTPQQVPGWFGWENQGGGIAVADLDGNSRYELIIYHIDNPGGENHGYYRIGWNLI